jgi:hypothetical protein
MRALGYIALTGVLLTATACGSVTNLLAGEPLSNGVTPAAARPPLPGIDGRLDWNGQQSAAQSRIFLTARNDAEWRDMWHLAATKPPGPLPDGWIAVGVFLGMRNTGGYGVAIRDVAMQQIQPQRDQLTVSYDEKVPATGMAVSQALTSPWAIRLIRATDAPIRFARAN